MSKNTIDYNADHYCPAYREVITADLCYESLMCLNRSFKISSVPELKKIDDIEKAREECQKCVYSNME